MFDDVSSAALRVALTGLAQRQRVTANNIANIETPGFRAGRVQFESALRDAVDSTDDSGVIGAVEATTAQSLQPTRLNGNNVNLDHETLSNIDTGLRYQLMLRALDNKYSGLSTVIRGS
ncbi:flagellar basal-body rod protein FlgB [Pilimelia terevasa]|uniref:Flagellar basal body rod protein FlgB n=1 Tax=Pilimelia terevasa TaxID=53372 RepID=A0A8J3BIZ4_9ACTN|nr:flagellar basal body rod protein FlgB [Pilimelia terevasa]GGK18242.1 flagellar basal-body rod protein FlgB [Pilimelia terevasa]